MSLTKDSETVTLILSYLPLKLSPSITPASSNPSDSNQQQSVSPPVSSSDDGKTEPEPEPSYIDAKNSFGNTALHWACLGGHLDVVKLLLSRGARPTAANDKDQIPLDLAAFNSHMHVVDYFLSQSKDIEGDNAKGGDGASLAGAVKDVEIDDAGGDGDGEAPVR